MSLLPVSKWLKDHWYTITMVIMLTTILSTGISYYAKAETEKLIQESISSPMNKIDQKLEDIKRTQDAYEDEIVKQKIEIERSKEKLNSIDDRLDLIIRLLDDRTRNNRAQ